MQLAAPDRPRGRLRLLLLRVLPPFILESQTFDIPSDDLNAGSLNDRGEQSCEKVVLVVLFAHPFSVCLGQRCLHDAYSLPCFPLGKQDSETLTLTRPLGCIECRFSVSGFLLGRQDSASVALLGPSGCIEFPLFVKVDGMLLVGLSLALTSPRGSTSAH